jgi:hypothetical protein
MSHHAPARTLEALRLPEQRDLYYGGAWHSPRSGRYADVRSPATDESLGPVAEASEADAALAVSAAQEASGSGAGSHPWNGRSCCGASAKCSAIMPRNSPCSMRLIAATRFVKWWAT